ncbi:MAG: helix-turn-helix transcriptional regulator [Clostridia bacterium]|nr:helix-turn-helix transcriptional regulator [Clostridia bacterium]
MISYEPFWETLKKKNITTYTLINKYHISSATIDRMKKGNGISTMKIDDFCKILKCEASDIIKYIDDEKSPDQYA